MEEISLQENIAIKPRKVSPFDKRIHEIDFLRGILIIMVVMDHTFWNFHHYMGDWGMPNAKAFFDWYWTGLARSIVQPLCLILFCTISGLSCAFSRNNWKRSAELILFAGLISVLTNLGSLWGWFGTIAIEFNVISVLGWSTLLYCFTSKGGWKWTLAMTLALFLLQSIWIPIWLELPNANNYWLPAFTVPQYYYSADYMPLFPYIIFFFLGATVTTFIYKNKKSLLPKGNWERPICFIGRHTLIIYLVHQIIMTPLFMLIDVLIRKG